MNFTNPDWCFYNSLAKLENTIHRKQRQQKTDKKVISINEINQSINQSIAQTINQSIAQTIK